ncbi:MAG: hypothetical protein LBP70_01465, partial [Mycoplasmataceae bacterium]|nr:hypothetical protein [Mycoplasmataceae bacterium]
TISITLKNGYASTPPNSYWEKCGMHVRYWISSRSYEMVSLDNLSWTTIDYSFVTYADEPPQNGLVIASGNGQNLGTTSFDLTAIHNQETVTWHINIDVVSFTTNN